MNETTFRTKQGHEFGILWSPRLELMFPEDQFPIMSTEELSEIQQWFLKNKEYLRELGEIKDYCSERLEKRHLLDCQHRLYIIYNAAPCPAVRGIAKMRAMQCAQIIEMKQVEKPIIIDQSGWVYVLSAPGSLYKIGMTQGPVTERILAFSPKLPFKVEISPSTPCSKLL